MFDTPVPFLIGMHVSNKAHINRFVNPGQTYVANFVEVNLDTSTCTFTKETGILIPKPLIVRVMCLSIALGGCSLTHNHTRYNSPHVLRVD